MTIKSTSNGIEFSCRKKPTPEERRKIRERINDPHVLTGMDRLRAFYEKRGLEFDEESFEKIVSDCLSQI
ncbi:MAG: hypothetical protein IKF11_08980 [Methanobrevibacter sp.]|nr:hypothetical protein [Methanobrevibacter sp.]